MQRILSPLDGRYRDKVHSVAQFFSEEDILRSKYNLEIDYMQFLSKKISLKIKDDVFQRLRGDFNSTFIGDIEKSTKHDIKAIELYIAENIKTFHPTLDWLIPLIHFGLTSQDVNSFATSNALAGWHKNFGLEILSELIFSIDSLSESSDLPFPARTHGQFAVLTSLKKEISLFSFRLKEQKEKLNSFDFRVKFGGAVGNLSAHYAAYPDINWEEELTHFMSAYGLVRQKITTQVDNNDWLAEYFSIWVRINNILIDFCRDIWMYFSYGYFEKRVTPEEIGSSTMPQKINPIEFENGEGNLEFANSIFTFMSSKLQVSRMQRDLTDTTVIRNLGLPFGHSVVAYNSIVNGCKKISADKKAIERDISLHPELIAENIQTILRANGKQDAYNMVKKFFSGRNHSQQDVLAFVADLNSNGFISEEEFKKIFKILIGG
jgi:adenylosuccinate lyase